MNMEKIARIVLMACVSMLMLTTVSCDWTFGGGVDSWNSRWNWVNFSGVYRAISGGVLVTDYSVTPGTDPALITVENERIATGDDSRIYSGTLQNRPIDPGSLTLNIANLRDDGEGRLAGQNASGSIDYGSGGWSINVIGGVENGAAITASYRYIREGTAGDSSAGSGVTGARIVSFTVHQEGEQLRIVDNNGAEYRGKMGSIRGSSGYDGTGPRPVGETVIAQFTAEGASASGMQTKLIGTFEGTLGAAGEGASTLANRRMTGTWIESGGRTGDINGFAGNVIIRVPEEGDEL